jgi:hypothetical protein
MSRVATWLGRILRRSPDPARPAIPWSSSVSSFRARPEHWALAAAAIYDTCNGHPWDRMHAPDAAPVRAMLGEAWSITTRADLLGQLGWLLVDGHRSELYGLVAHVAQCSETQVQELQADVARDDEMGPDARAQLLWRIEMTCRNERQLQSETFVAWDLARFLMLCKAGATCGLITEGEAEDFMLLACMQLKQTYHGWRDYGAHFLRGRWFWQAASQPETPASTFDLVIRALQESDDSPWRLVPWGMDLPSCRWLLVDALHASDLLTPLTDEARAESFGWRLALDRALREKQLDHVPSDPRVLH